MIHSNSIKAYHELTPPHKQQKYHVIYDILDIFGKPMTDREILKYMYGPEEKDMNLIRPRLTEMKELRYITECGKTKDTLTHKTVRLLRITTINDFAETQQELFN